MKLFTAAAVAILMSSGMAFAQDTNTTGSTTRVDTDPGNYLAGPKTQELYTDEFAHKCSPAGRIQESVGKDERRRPRRCQTSLLRKQRRQLQSALHKRRQYVAAGC